MRAAAFLFAVMAGVAAAQTPLELPLGAVETARTVRDPGSYGLPMARFSRSERPTEQVEGRVVQAAYRTPPGRSDPLAAIRALRPQIEAAGFEIVLDCAAAECGGFDFRFAVEVFPPPAMEVPLGDFRFLSARRSDPPGAIGIIASRSQRGGFIQVTEVSESGAPAPALATPEAAPTDGSGGAIRDRLETNGSAVLEGVAFESGSTVLGPDAIASLAGLAGYLSASPDVRVMIVGHTDAEGGLDANIAVSRARAAAVRDALVGTYGIAPDRIEPAGAGFLAPRASNATEAGRALNRRVEVILR